MIARTRSPAKMRISESSSEQVEARRARVALAAGAAAQLVVDAPRLVALGGDDAQAALRLDGVVQALPLVLQLLRPRRASRRLGDRLVGVDDLDLVLDVAAEHDVGAAAGHVGGDRDHARPPGLGDDLGLRACCLALSTACGSLALSSRPETSSEFSIEVVPTSTGWPRLWQSRMSSMTASNFSRAGLVDEVELVLADGRQVRRDHHRLEAVDLLELVGLGVGRAGHAGRACRTCGSSSGR